MADVVIYALTAKGAVLGKSLADELGGVLCLPSALAQKYGAHDFRHLVQAVRDNFKHYPRQIFICSTGIAVRCLAPHVQSKALDPAVVVLDEEGRYSISLLSGHLGGGNDFCREVAQLIGGMAIITTATDSRDILAIDLLAQSKGLRIENLQAIKSINMCLLEGEDFAVYDPEDWLGLAQKPLPGYVCHKVDSWEEVPLQKPAVLVSWKSGFRVDMSRHLLLRPGCLVVGVGCNRGTSAEEILALWAKVLEEHRLSSISVNCLATIALKENEPGLKQAVKILDIPLIGLTPQNLQEVQVPNPSAVVQKSVGVLSVCEASAIIQARKGKLLVPKTKTRNATMAVALENCV